MESRAWTASKQSQRPCRPSYADLTVHSPILQLLLRAKAGLLRHFTTLPRKRCRRVAYAKSVATHEILTCIASMQRVPVIRKTLWLGRYGHSHMTDAAQQLRLSSALNLDLPSFSHRVKDVYVVERGPAAHQVLPGPARPAAQAPPQNTGNAAANVVPQVAEHHIANHAAETVAAARSCSSSNPPTVQTGEHGIVATATAASASDANPADVRDAAETATSACLSSSTPSGTTSASAGPMSQQSRKG